MGKTDIDAVKRFWELHPVAASAIPHEPGTPEFFRDYDVLREKNESLRFSYELHEYEKFSGKKVLDIGCGNGYVLSHYAKEGAQVVGVDVTSTAIRLSAARFRLSALSGDFMVANAEMLPFASGSFDCVCSMGVLHHTPAPELAVKEILRVLRPGGRLILMFYHRNSALYRLNFFFQSLMGGISKAALVNQVDGLDNPKGEVYSKDELCGLLGAFEDLELFCGVLQGWMILPRGGSLLPNKLLHPLAKRWGWFLYAKGRKPQQVRESADL